ncbi:MAG: M48 family metalloprotease [Chitinivibrionales bacterium]|nr:M48 family metalloprotease [Chitinivibrionales bacterium]
MKRIFFILSSALFVFSPSFHCSKVVDTATDWFVSDSQEVVMGKNLYRQIAADKKTYPMLDTTTSQFNKGMKRYIDSIGAWLATHQTVRPENEFLRYTFSVINNDTMINAFAIPGGNVFIYTGLVRKARNEAEIAAVLGHELAHIAKRHGVKTMVQAAGISYIEKLILGSDSSLLTEATNALLFLKFSRDHEYEADSCSGNILIAGGYNPSGMKTFLHYLAQIGTTMFEPLSTHPDTDKRVKAIEDFIATKPASVNTLPTPPNRYATRRRD